MAASLAAGFVEQIPSSDLVAPPGKSWWLPIFPVTNIKKKKTRLVFDASAKYYGMSLNDRLLQGPDRNNALRGVLLRFRLDPVAFIADIQAMYNSFSLDTKDRQARKRQMAKC